ncbi:MAG: hypothetical protein HYZ07_02060 [Candidatus Harrisonbacteria bacterium]|nr:hypothetical protein [Candidatus Harrisonbacteria bacterium]
MRKFARTLLPLIAIVHVAFLTGCGTIHFTGLSVIEEPDGVVVTNCTSDFTIVVKKLGGTSTGITTRMVASPMLGPGGTWVVDTKNLSYGTSCGSYDRRYDRILIWCDVYRHGVYVGEARYLWNGDVNVPPQGVYRDIWPVHDSDLRFRSADHDCP